MGFKQRTEPRREHDSLKIGTSLVLPGVCSKMTTMMRSLTTMRKPLEENSHCSTPFHLGKVTAVNVPIDAALQDVARIGPCGLNTRASLLVPSLHHHFRLVIPDVLDSSGLRLPAFEAFGCPRFLRCGCRVAPCPPHLGSALRAAPLSSGSLSYCSGSGRSRE